MVEWLLADVPARVVDLGAGTGKLTRALVGRAETVVAVEPDPGMRRVLSELLPGTSLLAGTGEDIPLRDGYADAIVVGQAWHWVDPARAVPEVARVLRPGGSLGLIWNDRDEGDPWVQALSALLHEYGTSPDADYEPARRPAVRAAGTAEQAWRHEVPVASVIDMITSRSYVIALPPDGARSSWVGSVSSPTRPPIGQRGSCRCRTSRAGTARCGHERPERGRRA